MGHNRIRRGLAAATGVALVAISAPSAADASPPFEPEALAVRRCVIHSDLTTRPQQGIPDSLRATIATGLADERLHRVGLGASVWIEGFGEVIAVNPDLRLRPASNQKLLTAVGALALLGEDTRLQTAVAAYGTRDGSILDGDLYLVGGGDPTVTATGTHSLEALAAAVAGTGVSVVTGSLVADESRYDTRRRANGWTDPVSPTWVGALSALMVDENRYRIEASYLADPVADTVVRFSNALATAGVVVLGGTGRGVLPQGAQILATLDSPPVADLVSLMLTDSNNTIAEMLVKEVGFQIRGVGSTAVGLEVIATVLDDFCLPEAILQQDGSGLSHGNARSARDWRRLMMSAQAADWYDEVVDGLAVAAETGTLRFRFRDTEAAGNLRAKTGTITGIRSLTGVMTTAGDRRVFFSFIVDDDEPRPPMSAIDDLLAAIAADES
jgi:D-alanyl-D-alanine carboxypeptidase/D-alanyl-D-alanine-endopeptidase (penicillin-binding protein 4)